MKKISSLLFAIFIFWANVVSAQHLKKDGTPDMRYKENKVNTSLPTQTSTSTNYYPTSSPSTDYSATHLKKDGTPDKRFKENKISTTNHVTTKTPSYPKYHTNSTPLPSYTKSNYSSTVVRDANGKIKRSEAAKLTFMKQSGYPHGRPGYVIDHIIPLKKGGCDCPNNMQWQTIAAAKEKDKWE